MSNWTAGDISGSQTLISTDHLYASHVNELRSHGNANVQASAFVVGMERANTLSSGTSLLTDGTSDQIQIQAAISANANSSSSRAVIEIGEGEFDIRAAMSFGVRKIKLRGAGMGRTVLKMNSSFSGFAMFYDYTNGISDIEIEGITFDMNNVNGKGLMELGTCSNVYIHDCEMKNTGDSGVGGSHWTVKIGEIDNADITGSASENVVFERNFVHDNYNGTNETILPINCRNSRFDRNYFEGNSNTAFTLNLFGYCYNTSVSGNTFRNSVSAIYVLSCDSVSVVDNRGYADASGQDFVTVSNSRHVKVSENLYHAWRSGGLASSGIKILDRADPFDGHPQLYDYSKYVSITDNDLYDCYYGIIINSSSGIFNKYVCSEITIADNRIWSCEWQGILVGKNNSAVDISNVYIERNYIGTSNVFDHGSIAIIGYSSDITKVHDIYIRDNHVKPSSRSNAAGIELDACSIVYLERNVVTGTGKGTLAGKGIYVVNGSTIAISRIDVTSFGAVGDGSTDNTATFQTVCDVLDTTGGNIVVPGGTFVTGQFTMSSNTTLEGIGFASKLKLKNSTNDHMIATRDTIAGATTYPHDHQIKNLYFDLNKANNTTTAGAVESHKNRNLFVENCSFVNFKGNCVYVSGSVGNNIQPRIINNQFDNGDRSDGVGIKLDSGCYDAYLESNDVGRCWRGIIVSNGGQGNHTLVANWVWAHEDAGLYLYQSHGNQIIGLTADNNFGHGVVVDGCNSTTFVGGKISNNSYDDAGNIMGYGAGYGTANTNSGVRIINASTNIRFNGTTFECPDNAQKYHLLVEDTSTAIESDCSFTGAGTSDFSVAAGASLKRGILVTYAPTAYTTSNVTTDRSYDANATTLDEVADVLGTLISDLRSNGIIG